MFGSWCSSPLLLVLALLSGNTHIAAKAPNFLVVLTDDQDYMMESSSRKYMPYLNSLIGDKGTELRNFCVSMAWCCPSRVSLLTGKHTHNTNITSSSEPYGGAFKAWSSGILESNYIATWLTDLGYNTYFTGKFLNQLTVDQVDTSCPRGWRIFEGMVDGSYNNWYTSTSYSNNCSGIQHYKNTFQTTIMRDKGLAYIDHALAEKKPFFIELAPVAPHDQGSTRNAMPAPGDEDAFPDAEFPVPPNYNVSLPDAMILSYPVGVQLAFSQEKWINRIRSLKSVDEMVKALVDKLEAVGELDNTYILYTSDNGFHLGHHAMPYLKFTPFEEDVRVPFFMRGPTIPVGVKSDYQATMVDVPATIVALAGGKLLPQLDGIPIPFHAISKGLAGPILELSSTTSAASAALVKGRIHHIRSSPSAVSASIVPRILLTVTSSAASPPVDPPSASSAPPQLSTSPQPSNNAELDGSSPFFPSSHAPADLGEVVVGDASTSSAVSADQTGYEGETDRAADIHPPAIGPHFSVRANTSQVATADGQTDEQSVAWRNSSAMGSRLLTASYATPYVRDSIIIEGWLDMPGMALFHRKNYRVIRTCSPFLLGPSVSTFLGVTCYKFSVWCVPGVHSHHPRRSTYRVLHDLGADPFELVNLLPSSHTEVARLVDRLNAALTVLAYCKGKVCRNPWAVIHPDGTVQSLQQAMATKYNSMYAAYKKFDYHECSKYYSMEDERPDDELAALASTASATALLADAL